MSDTAGDEEMVLGGFGPVRLGLAPRPDMPAMTRLRVRCAPPGQEQATMVVEVELSLFELEMLADRFLAHVERARPHWQALVDAMPEAETPQLAF